MIVFDDNTLEIAIATYKRPEYVAAWLKKCYQSAKERNIAISVYDSSPDDKTSKEVLQFCEVTGAKIDYHHVDENTFIGYKPMIPIMETQSEYLWVSGDSRYHDFEELDDKVFPYIAESKVEYIVINTSNNYQLPDTMYDDKGKMLHDTFVASTCIGLSIYRVSIFDRLRKNEALMTKCDMLFKNNYGFGWLGYFYQAFANDNYKAMLANVKTLSVLKKKKTQSWARRFYGCWVDDLCQIVDNIPDDYYGKEQIPQNTWDVMKLASAHYGYFARKHGDLDSKKYEEIVSNGLIYRVTEKPNRIKFYATAPVILLGVNCLIYDMFDLFLCVKRKVYKIMCGRK